MRGIIVAGALLLLSGCAGIPAALPLAFSAAGGAVTVAKDVLDLDVSWHQLKQTEQTKP